MSDETSHLELVNDSPTKASPQPRRPRTAQAGKPCPARAGAAEAMLKSLYPPGSNPKGVFNTSYAFRRLYCAQADVEAVAMEPEVDAKRCAQALAMAAEQLARIAVHFYEHGWLLEARHAHQASLNLRLAGHRARGRR